MTRQRPAWLWALVTLVLVTVANLILTPGFGHLEVRDGRIFGSIVDVANRAAPTMLLALGMTLVIGTGGVDLSVGAVMAITGTVAACLLVRPEACPLNFVNVHSSIPFLIGLALLVALACGLFSGTLVAVFEIQPIVATLLLMVAGRGIAQLFANGQIVTFKNSTFGGIGSGAILGLPTPIWICGVGFLAVGCLARSTAFGLFIEATGSNPIASAYAGVSTLTVKLAVYLVSAFCAGIAGLIMTADIQAADANNVGLYMELDAILAVSVGGTSLTGGRFSLIGSVIGVLLMQAVTTTILTRGIAPEVALIVKAVIVIAVCLMQSPKTRELIQKRSAA